MQILKKILIGLLAIVVFLLVVALFLPKTYTVSESVTINQPKQRVFEYAKSLKNQEQYSIWVMSDLGSVSYKNPDSEVGAIQMWNSKDDNIGEGEQEITSITDERIDVDLRFKRPFESQQKAAVIVKSVSENQTQVTSEFYGSDAYPMNLMSFVGKKIIKDAEVKNLQNMKAILEK